MAKVDMFLKLDGVKGESKDDKHKDEIHIESFSWGTAQEGSFGSGGGGGAGKVNVGDIDIKKFADKSSPTLWLNCCSGKHIKEGLLTVRKAGEKPVEYLKIKLTDVLVSSFKWENGEDTDSVIVTESLSLNFAKVEIEYQEQKADGSKEGGPVTGGWDAKANKKV